MATTPPVKPAPAVPAHVPHTSGATAPPVTPTPPTTPPVTPTPPPVVPPVDLMTQVGERLAAAVIAKLPAAAPGMDEARYLTLGWLLMSIPKYAITKDWPNVAASLGILVKQVAPSMSNDDNTELVAAMMSEFAVLPTPPTPTSK